MMRIMKLSLLLICCGSLFPWVLFSAEPAAQEEAARLVEILDWEAEMARKFQRNVEVLKKNLPTGFPEEMQPALSQALEDGLAAIWAEADHDALKKQVIAWYAETYSQEELQALNTFWASPVGQRWRATENELAANLEEALTGHMIAHLPLLQERILQVLNSAEECCDDPHHHHHHAH